MVILPFQSTELEEWATSLLKISAALNAQAAERHSVWEGLRGFTDADSLLAGIHQLHRHNESLQRTAQRMDSVAEVLWSTAGAVRLLESGLRIVESLSDHSPAVTAFLTHISQMAKLLDLVCAAQIQSLCTPDIPVPLRQLGDFKDLPATAIHEFNLMNAPPEIKEFAAANPDATLLEVSEGTLVAAFGDIDQADTVLTMVAGVSSSEASHWQGNIDRARTLNRSSGTATVMWLGYTAPASVSLAASARSAEQGGAKLQKFQESLDHRNPSQRKVVLGYSYGSVVVGKAAARSSSGFDALILVGSPGAGVSHARQLGEEVYAVTGHKDPIGLAATRFGGIHGADPTSYGFGSTVWESDSTHSSYWEDPSFYRNLESVLSK